MTTLIRRLGALVCWAATLSVAVLGAQLFMAYTGAANLLIRGPGAAIFVVVPFALYLATMFIFGLLLGRCYRARRLQWAALGLAGAPLPLAGFAIAMGGDDAGDPVFRLLLYVLLAVYALYALALVLFGRRVATRRDMSGSLRAAGLCLAGGGGFYLAHAAVATLATVHDGFVFPFAALVLMVMGGGVVALAEAAIGLAMWRGPRHRRPGALTPSHQILRRNEA